MKNTPHILIKTGYLIFLAAILLSSCVPMKRIRYLQDPKNKAEARNDFQKPVTPEYLVHKGDNLYVKVKSLDEKEQLFR